MNTTIETNEPVESKQRPRRKPRKNQRGLTLIEILVVVTILGLIAGIVGITVANQLEDARIDTANIQMKNIAEALELKPGTVASRLRRAREDFDKRVKRVEARMKSKEVSAGARSRNIGRRVSLGGAFLRQHGKRSPPRRLASGRSNSWIQVALGRRPPDQEGLGFGGHFRRPQGCWDWRWW